jgi:hypothetical protein
VFLLQGGSALKKRKKEAGGCISCRRAAPNKKPGLISIGWPVYFAVLTRNEAGWLQNATANYYKTLYQNSELV